MPVATFDVAKQFRAVQTVDVFVEARHKDPTGADDLFTFTQRVLTYPAGSSIAPKTDARLGAISRPTFQLSDRSGQLRGVSCTLDVIDTDYFIRGWLENPFQDNLSAVELTIWIIPEDQRRAELTPRPYFRGVVREPELLPDRMVRFVCEDPFTAKFGADVPFYAVGRTQFPNAPTASIGVVVSPAYGDLADLGVTDAPPQVTEEAISGSKISPRCLVPLAVFAGYASVGGTVPTGFSMIDDPASGGEFSSYVGNIRVGMVRYRPSGGAWSDPVELLPKDGDQLAGLAGEDSTIVMACDNMGVGGDYQFILGVVFNNVVELGQAITTSSPTATFTRDNTPDGATPTTDNITPGAELLGMLRSRAYSYVCWARLAGGKTVTSAPVFSHIDGFDRPVRFTFSPVTGAIDYGVARSFAGANFDNLQPTDFRRQFTVLPSSTNGAGDIVFEDDYTGGLEIEGLETPVAGVVPGVHVGPHTCLDGVSREMFLFAHGPIKEVVLGTLNGTSLAAARYGADVWLPDQTGWGTVAAADTVTVDGYEFVVGFLSGLAAAAVLEDGEIFAANLLGVMDDDDDLMTSIYDQLVHVANNFTLAATPYQGGAWNAPAAFSDATLIVDTDSVDAVKARADALIPSGPAGAWFYREAVTGQQLHADLHLSGGVDGGWQPSGQYRIALWDQAVSPSRRFTEVQDIVAATFSAKDAYQRLENAITHESRYNVSAGAYDQSGTYAAAASIAKFGRKVPDSGPIPFRMRRQVAPCSEMASQRALRYGQPLRLAPVTLAGFHGVDLLPGDAILIDHSDGTGTTASKGWSARPVRVDSIAPDAVGHVVALIVEDYRQAGSLVGIEDIMAERSFGGSRHNSLVLDSAIVRLYDWRSARVLGSLVPASYARTARLWIKVDAGNATPVIKDQFGTPMATGSAETSTAAFVLQEITIPYSAAEKEYIVEMTLAGGATRLGSFAFGDLILEP